MTPASGNSSCVSVLDCFIFKIDFDDEGDIEFAYTTLKPNTNMATRRKFIQCALCTATVACVPEAKFGDPSTQLEDTGGGFTDVDICNIIPDSTWSTVSLDEHPALNAVGGFAYIELGGRNLIVAHVKSGCFVSPDRACTMKGKPSSINLKPNGLVRDMQPHFATGDVIAGPAPSGLEYYPTAQHEL